VYLPSLLAAGTGVLRLNRKLHQSMQATGSTRSA
jgi:hypothetical protein